MTQEGPALALLLRRIAETPADFFGTPRTDDGKEITGVVDVSAVIKDLFDSRGLQALPQTLGQLRFRTGVPALRLSLLLAWLLAEPALTIQPRQQGALEAFLTQGVKALAEQAEAELWFRDPERREELARSLLATLDLRPEGETLAQAQDRLTRISALERSRLMAATRASEERASALRKALAQKAAQEAADKWTRE